MGGVGVEDERERAPWPMGPRQELPQPRVVFDLEGEVRRAKLQAYVAVVGLLLAVACGLLLIALD